MNPSAKNEDELDLLDLFYYLFRGKWIILCITFFVTVISMLYSLYLPNIYESKSLLAPIENAKNRISGALDSVSSIAGISGLDIGTSNNITNSVRALVKVKTHSFFEYNILPNIFLPDLMAVKSLDVNDLSIVYDSDIYNQSDKLWVTKVPSVQQSHNRFIDKHLSISEEKETGFVTLSIKHQSPVIAKKWTELVVSQINSYYSIKDKAEAERAVAYLNNQMLKTSFSEIKQVIASLLEQETQKLTLIEANNSYVFEYIDPPIVMEHKVSPRRVLIFIISSVLGLLLGALIVSIKYFLLKKYRILQ